MTSAVTGVPYASKQGTNSKVAQKCKDWLHNPCCLGGPQQFTTKNNIGVGPQWAWSLHSPCSLGGPQRIKAADEIRSGPQVGGLAI